MAIKSWFERHPLAFALASCVGIAVVQSFAFFYRRGLEDAARSIARMHKVFAFSLCSSLQFSAVLCSSLRSSAFSAVKMLLTSPSERRPPAFHPSPSATLATADTIALHQPAFESLSDSLPSHADPAVHSA